MPRRWRTASGRRLTIFGRNSGLTSAQYSQPVLGLIFLRFAEVRFLTQRAVLEKQAAGGRRGSRVDDPTAYQAEGILYLTPPARFDHILRLPEGSDVGKAVNKAMRDIEAKNPQLTGVLPKTYQIFNSTLLKNLLKKVSEIPATAEGDTFGRVYEYFLGEFARTEGSRGRRVLYPDQHRSPARRGVGAVSRSDSRPGLRFRRHVRPERPLRGGAQAQSRG